MVSSLPGTCRIAVSALPRRQPEKGIELSVRVASGPGASGCLLALRKQITLVERTFFTGIYRNNLAFVPFPPLAVFLRVGSIYLPSCVFSCHFPCPSVQIHPAEIGSTLASFTYPGSYSGGEPRKENHLDAELLFCSLIHSTSHVSVPTAVGSPLPTL